MIGWSMASKSAGIGAASSAPPAISTKRASTIWRIKSTGISVIEYTIPLKLCSPSRSLSNLRASRGVLVSMRSSKMISSPRLAISLNVRFMVLFRVGW
jgi:hypothetical protein